RILAESGDDAFDVGARSDAYWLDALWPLAVHEECIDAADGAEALRSFAAAAGSEALERVLELARAQQRRDRYREALHRIRKACADSVDEADAVSVEVETQLAADGPGPIDEQLARIRSLVRLATSRFGGIAEMWAIDFECDLPMQGLRTRLAEHTGWCWTARDNDRLGDYASSYHAGMMFKVYDEHGSGDGPSYTLALARTPYCAKPRAQVDQAGAGLITAVGGRNPRPGHIDEWR
ncbi:MAG TPA: hypothetical protein VND91_03345, partial [Candidatus Saccharimonadia bacterium]|nr:hypothetical protein [Candidatus Saccharimonadia bacterium]